MSFTELRIDKNFQNFLNEIGVHPYINKLGEHQPTQNCVRAAVVNCKIVKKFTMMTSYNDEDEHRVIA